MGAYTTANFEDYLLLRLGNNTALQSPTNYLRKFVNQAYRFLAMSDKPLGSRRALYFPELETSTVTGTTTVDGTAYISTPTDALLVREVYDTTNKKRLDWMSWPDYIGKTDRADTSSESQPSYWHRSGGYIYLYQTPDAAYVMRVYYKLRVNDLDGATYNYTVLGKEWDDVILELAVWFGRNWLNEPERAEYAKKTALEMIVGLQSIYSAEEKARREGFRPTPESIARPSY
jgi:hypothetical protein